MEQTMIMVMQTVQTFSEKSKTYTLTEYEALMYEQCCNIVATFARLQDRIGQLQYLDVDKTFLIKQQEFNKWEKDHNANTDYPNRDSPPGDEGTDPKGGCAGQPVQ